MKRKLNLKERIQQFKAWRETPHPVAPNTEEEHECANCHDRYQGKFCPRCGQASRIGRYSFKTGILNFFDVWGLGNRSMFLTIRDLILRPGYMIRDFLKGMQMAYFPPFKMFFLLFALSVLVTHGLNIKGIDISNDAENEYVLQEMKEVNTAKETTAVDISDANKSNDSTAERVGTILRDFLYNIARFEKRFPSVFILMLLMLVSGVLYLFFRHSPSIPDLRYSEFFVSLVYIANMYTVYSIVLDFFCLTTLSSFAILLTLIPLKQLTGYSWWRTILKSFTASLIMFVLLVLLIVLSVLSIGLFVENFG